MRRHKLSGFTLIEMLLVLVIISTIIVLGVGYLQQRVVAEKIDRTGLHMQQILNAGLAYYVTNGSWPPDLDTLRGTYLPPLTVNFTNGWGQPFAVVSTNTNFYVYTAVIADTPATASAQAQILAGKVPLSYVTEDISNTPPAQVNCTGTTCYTVASVNLPGENLNNANAVHFAGLYHHGGCIPRPTCPVATMIPQVMVVPVSVSGLNDPNTTNTYPITSFTGYATGPLANPPACTGGTAVACNPQNAQGELYWRACIQVITERGEITSSNTSSWGEYVTLMAITRCAVSNEPSGSPFTVFSN